LVIVDGHPLATSEINAFYRRSAVVWNAYHGSMQSGVLPKAFMFGTPVVSRAGNANEYVRDGVTGVLVGDTADTLALRTAVQRVLDRQHEFTFQCREAFLGTFYYRNYARIFDRAAKMSRS
jgi:glycosyltransferase involved in cell wall biosynthesis